MRCLQLLASQAAISLENAHLYTDLEQAKEKARQSARELRLALNSIPALAWSAAPDGSSEVFNKQWHDFTGLSPAEADSGGWQASYHHEDLGKVVDKWRQILAAGQTGEVEARMRRFDGIYRRFLIRGTPLRDESGKIIRWYGTNTDIEDLKRAEEELRLRETDLRKAQAELAHVTRVTTMGELAASIAHEVSQPIAGVLLNGTSSLRWLSRINEDPASLGEVRESLLRIVRDGNRASEVIARIRTLFKKAETPKGPLDLNEAIREVIILTRSEMDKKRVALRLELMVELPTILGDRVQLQQVVMNLILNAIEAMSTVEGRSRELSIGTRVNEEKEILVTIRDSGVGLDPQSMEQVFAAFHTTKPGGLGMGLSISRSIVENHAGRLWACANDGFGATFQFTLPSSATV